MKKTWFQQNEATTNDTNVVLKRLKEKFGLHAISRCTTLAWPPRSPDITIYDFFLEVYVKSKVFKNWANNLIDLKTQIKAVIKEISKQLLEDVAKNVCGRFPEYIDSNDLQNVVFKK